MIDKPQNIKDTDVKFLKDLNISKEVINITKKVVNYDNPDEIDFITVDGLMYYYDGHEGSTYVRIADAKSYYVGKEYLDVNVIDRFEKDFGYEDMKNINLVLEFHKKEKLRKLINKL